MTPMVIIDLFREAMLIVISIVSIMVLPSLLIGLMISMFQAATQINEQTLSFLPRLLTTISMLIIAGPWILNKLIDFTQRLMTAVPGMLG
jgi:flagellar biosynthetic protein FliQ